MDRFDLHWPRTEAAFLTDGRRCRIVWRSGHGRSRGPGGSIDNNALCKKRVADSLPLAPDLLGELKSRGYANLADEIRELAGGDAPPDARVSNWLGALAGDGTWAETGARRGKTWIRLGASAGEAGQVLELRAPSGRGRVEWVLRRTAAGTPRQVDFVAAASLKGIFACLVAGSDGDSAALVDGALAACASLDHPEAKAACESWQSC